MIEHWLLQWDDVLGMRTMMTKVDLLDAANDDRNTMKTMINV